MIYMYSKCMRRVRECVLPLPLLLLLLLPLLPLLLLPLLLLRLLLLLLPLPPRLLLLPLPVPPTVLAAADLTTWQRLINATGREEMLQNCHWGGDTPYHRSDGSLWCPYNIYRTGADIVPDYKSDYSGAGLHFRSACPHGASFSANLWLQPRCRLQKQSRAPARSLKSACRCERERLERVPPSADRRARTGWASFIKNLASTFPYLSADRCPPRARARMAPRPSGRACGAPPRRRSWDPTGAPLTRSARAGRCRSRGAGPTPTACRRGTS